MSPSSPADRLPPAAAATAAAAAGSRKRNTPSRRRPQSQSQSQSLSLSLSSQQSHTPAPPRQPSTGHVPSHLAPPWPFDPQETALIRAGYRPAYKPKPIAAATHPTDITTTAAAAATDPTTAPSKRPRKMAEPRARAARHKGQMNFSSELRLLLLAYGDPRPHPSFTAEPLPETIRVLDEIVTDFVLEMCHGAAQYASYSRRQKIKVDDFRFALRRDPNKLGRVQELLRMERELKEARKAFDQNDDQVGNLKDAGKKGLEEAGESVDGKKGKGKGKRNARRDSDATEDNTVPKKRKVGA
ncbi:TFIID-18kDa-domain-containing protein [Aspergillus heteromorphus CBS 117.55]|uniref:Transcription initiation factor TFIID subunit 13 n=1 Tax=Aspergillus heteromorphus CBS 117.55 TaxID=1448321 RepID=A0A317W648_9EURO|nr:TFIID-18kDa-domain-containing protein [Aspergillus heteromorphus CBS 117.55]PWY81823.1 TFIID-18kDa-domain-containing protein [Aspergillus heteromorphus CBS 117.55]